MKEGGTSLHKTFREYNLVFEGLRARSISYNFLVADYLYSTATLSFDTSVKSAPCYGLLNYSTSHTSTAVLIAMVLLYNTDRCLSIGFVQCS